MVRSTAASPTETSRPGRPNGHYQECDGTATSTLDRREKRETAKSRGRRVFSSVRKIAPLMMKNNGTLPTD
jgi:hypothetical protein